MKYKKIVEVSLPTKYGGFRLAAYQNGHPDIHHLALIKGDVNGGVGVPVRIHSSCVTGDILGSLRCDCGDQLAKALKYISKKDCGILLYLFQEGRGIGLINKLKAYQLQEQGLDTVEANQALGLPIDARSYDVACDILHSLRVKTINLLTNNPHKISGLTNGGVHVGRVTPLTTQPCRHNIKYLKTKIEKLGHSLNYSVNQTWPTL